MDGPIWFWFKQLVMGLLAIGWIYNQVQTIRHRLIVRIRVPRPTYPPPVLCPEINVLPNCAGIDTLPCNLTVLPESLPLCNDTTLAPCVLQERNVSSLSNDSGAGDLGESTPLVDLCANLGMPSTTEAPVIPPTKVTLMFIGYTFSVLQLFFHKIESSPGLMNFGPGKYCNKIFCSKIMIR